MTVLFEAGLSADVPCDGRPADTRYRNSVSPKTLMKIVV